MKNDLKFSNRTSTPVAGFCREYEGYWILSSTNGVADKVQHLSVVLLFRAASTTT